MESGDVETVVQQLTAQVLAEMKDWQEAHPRAMLEDIEDAVAVRWARVQARVIEAAAQAQEAALPSPAVGARPCCPACGHTLQGRGRRRRRVQTSGNQEITLERTYAVCPSCGTGVFPPR